MPERPATPERSTQRSRYDLPRFNGVQGNARWEAEAQRVCPSALAKMAEARKDYKRVTDAIYQRRSSPRCDEMDKINAANQKAMEAKLELKEAQAFEVRAKASLAAEELTATTANASHRWQKKEEDEAEASKLQEEGRRAVEEGLRKMERADQARRRAQRTGRDAHLEMAGAANAAAQALRNLAPAPDAP